MSDTSDDKYNTLSDNKKSQRSARPKRKSIMPTNTRKLGEVILNFVGDYQQVAEVKITSTAKCAMKICLAV